MEVFFKLNVCRVCLIPGTVESLRELKSEMFQELAEFETEIATLICGKCRETVRKCVELINDTRGFEKHVFEPMRDEFKIITINPDDRDPEIDVDFECCRACLMPVSQGPTESARANYGKLSKMLKSVTGVDLTNEDKVHNILFCIPCSKTLQQAVHVKYLIEQNKQYFKKIKSKLQCLNCNKVFASIRNLRRHIKESSCSATSISSTNQTIPMRSSHENVGKVKVSLKRRLMSDEASESLAETKICAAESSGSKKLICWCKKTFSNDAQLKLHKLVCTSYN